MAISTNTKTHIEHYLYGVVVAGVAIYQTGNHDIKKVAVAAIVGVLGPVVKAAVDKLKTASAK